MPAILGNPHHWMVPIHLLNPLQGTAWEPMYQWMRQQGLIGPRPDGPAGHRYDKSQEAAVQAFGMGPVQAVYAELERLRLAEEKRWLQEYEELKRLKEM